MSDTNFAHPMLRMIDSMFAGQTTCMNDIFRELAAEKKARGTSGTGRPSSGPRRRAKILERDGDNCWLCGKHMPEDDRTIEHLTAVSRGGTHDMDNLALCHFACNRVLGTFDLATKLGMREVRQASK